MLRHHAHSIERALIDLPTEWLPAPLLVALNAAACALHVAAHYTARSAS